MNSQNNMHLMEHDIDEINLWQQFLNGNQASLEKIYLLYFDELFNYGNRWLKNRALTEDSIQDLFIKLLSNRSGLSGTESVNYYLFRIVLPAMIKMACQNSELKLRHIE